jgi:hypothetical protein
MPVPAAWCRHGAGRCCRAQSLFDDKVLALREAEGVDAVVDPVAEIFPDLQEGIQLTGADRGHLRIADGPLVQLDQVVVGKVVLHDVRARSSELRNIWQIPFNISVLENDFQRDTSSLRPARPAAFPTIREV